MLPDIATGPRRCSTVVLPLLLALWLSGGRLEGQAEGYTIQDNQIRVDTREHWASWKVAVGAASITPDGSVTPRYLRKKVNLALDATDYGSDPPGGTLAGSRPETSGNVIDGDLQTWWGPDLDDPPQDWWVQIRLGRVAVVDSVVLHFVDEAVGEPFLQFDVMGWRQPPPLSPSKYNLPGTTISALWILYRTDRPNTTERRISFVPRTTERASPGFVGDPLEIIHILLTDTAGDRLREIAEPGYRLLPEDARGAVDYYRLSGSGRQTLTTAQAYANLEPERQGSVRYHRRERPRLAEVEVWAAGDNLNLGLVTSGAVTTMETERSNQPQDLATTITDGDYATGPSSSLFANEYITIFEDLGTLFWLDTIEYLTDYVSGSIYGFSVDISDGSLAPDGSILWRPAAQEQLEARFRSFAIEPARVRYLRTKFRTRTGTAQVSLMESLLYGEGYVAEALLTSDVIDLGGRKGLVSISWDVDTPEGTAVRIATRTGNRLTEEKIFHDSDGRVVTEERYRRRLPEVKKGEVTSRFVPGDDFSDWSLPYTVPGEEIRSPRTRRYLQLQARVLADTTSKGGPPAALHGIRIQLADLYTDGVTGEVFPTRVLAVGRPERRSYFLRPVYGNAEQGFDQVRVVASAATLLDLVEVRVGSEAAFRAGTARIIPAASIQRQPSGPDTLDLRLPEAVRQGVELVEVCMETTVHGNSAVFEAAVKSSARQGAWQLAEGGDATGLVQSETSVVIALADNRILSPLRVAPAVFTPNGDGVNDAAVFSFSLSRITVPGTVTLSVYDLSGRRVREMAPTRAEPRGSYAVAWDGTDDAGRRVPPGTYLVRLEADAESGRAEGTLRTQPVHVAY